MDFFLLKNCFRHFSAPIFCPPFCCLPRAFFLYRFRLKESQIRLAVAVIYVLSGALAGFFFARTTGKRRFFCGLAAGLSYFLILAAVSSFLGKGFTVSMPHLLTTMGMCIGGGIFGAVIS